MQPTSSRRPSPLNRKQSAATAPQAEAGEGQIALIKIEGRNPEMGIRISLENGLDYVFPYSSLGCAALQGDQLTVQFGDYEVTCFFKQEVLEKRSHTDLAGQVLDGIREQNLAGLRASADNGLTIEVALMEDEDD